MYDGRPIGELRDFMLTGRFYKRAKKQIIQTTDNDKFFFLVKSGYLKRYMISNTGAISIQVIYGPGDYFSITRVYSAIFGSKLNPGPEVYYYEALTEVEMYGVSVDALVKQAQNDPQLYKEFLCVAGSRLGSTLHGLENLGLRSAYCRVAHEVLFLARHYGVQKNDIVKIRMPLTHQDLADILSLTRETVSVSIGDLRKKGLIKTGKYIVVPSLKRLEREAFS